MSEKTHYRKAFHSPYLSAADIVEPTVFTIKYVRLEIDATKKTKDYFNTAHFVEKEIRSGEPLKPMILNATNSKTLKGLTNTPFIEDWNNVPVTIYVDSNVRFGRETMEGLRISPHRPETKKPVLTPQNEKQWNNAKLAFKRDGDLSSVLNRCDMSLEHQQQLIKECRNDIS